MPRPCTVCLHSKLPEIAADMANGVSDVQIAKRYALARSSVQRHRKHVGAPNSRSTSTPEGGGGDRGVSRLCPVCEHPQLKEIAADIANGMTNVSIAHRYDLPPRFVERHRQHTGSLSSAAAARRNGQAFQALALLPSAAEVNQAYASITSRIDAIATKAETEGSLAVALMGLRELRSTVTAQAQLAGHVGSAAQVQVNTQVNVDLGAAVKELIAAIRPRPDPAIPPVLAVHLEGASPDADTLARLEAVADGQ
jgi:hypothetical protein